MFQRNPILTVFLTATLLAAGTTAGLSSERHRHHERDFRRPLVVVGIELPRAPRHHFRHHRSAGTYSGDVAVIRVRGLGSWSYGYVGQRQASALAIQNAKIIDVETSAGAACDMQHGVCVIRP